MEELMRTRVWLRPLLPAALCALLWLPGRPASAHCDTLDGPVVAAARVALEKGDVTPVLRWIKPEFENEIRERFGQALAVRRLSPEAKALADASFFENLVRIHRLGEKAPYTGLQSGTRDPVVAWTDGALESGSPEALIQLVGRQVARGIEARFKTAAERKKRAEESVSAGRDFVESYVEYTHYVERLYGDALGGRVPGEAEAHSHEH
jgi:Family of unknown function (DUF6448)